jgi:hypothetical protein
MRCLKSLKWLKALKDPKDLISQRLRRAEMPMEVRLSQLAATQQSGSGHQTRKASFAAPSQISRLPDGSPGNPDL